MRRYAIERFLYRFDKDVALQARFAADPAAALAEYSIAADESAVLTARDVAQLYRWGVHPLLIRNFAGTLKIDYVAAYRRAGVVA